VISLNTCSSVEFFKEMVTRCAWTVACAYKQVLRISTVVNLIMRRNEWLIRQHGSLAGKLQESFILLRCFGL
jgi:hypothetical protein